MKDYNRLRKTLHPGSDRVATQLTALLTACPLSFLYIYDSDCARIASGILRGVCEELAGESTRFRYAFANAVACFTPRLFYDTVLNALSHHTPDWEDGCENWAGTSVEGQRWNESIDTFLHGLRAIAAEAQVGESNGKGKARASVNGAGVGARCKFVLAVERPERLKENMSELIVPLTRLAELSQVDIVTVFVSDVRWEDIRPPSGASPEPLYIDVPVLSKQDVLDTLASYFPPDESSLVNSNIDPDTYNPVFRPLYVHFVATVYSICGPFTHDPHELAYIAAARWPGFIQPILDEHRQRLREYEEYLASRNEDGDADAEDMGPPELVAPTEDARLRLIRLFTPSLTAALEALYPRLTNAADWARTHTPPPNLLTIHPSQVPVAFRAAAAGHADGTDVRGVDGLPRMARFVLVAAFLASTNPPKSDVRMFGRGPEDRKRRRRKGGGPRKGRAGTATKIPQRLLGPISFGLDRLLAILGVLLEENDAETRPSAPQYSVPGEYTDVEISRVAIFAQVMELSSMRLLMRTSPPEKIDSVPTFKCGISYDTALKLAKDVGIPLNSLVWEGIQYGNT
ncbi:origin recognition complex subunit 5 C-terminus-domain-containing protein [Rhodofomes roseus]|uniref:Origin recognition complex subunit 5 C-terminus-domain-containing protein n=1 Tax=Rhodofomes roseus TaxID=34475 RepID=A0ABQ8KD59_9APHY|nr:origin recognition complex subunit 5 C-terminus-domain-containing protein [Rhodofomes roseus]KAH9834986.1 origin recognition complex subunit 5 C-terminus-domain-containing protein [Rhodofomes roseus]